MMAAYVVVNIRVDDPVGYEKYKASVEASIAAYGGRYIVRGGHVWRLEGEWEPQRLVILEFTDAERAKAWWSSTEYAGPKAIRHATARTDLLVVEGV
jgi:uncharacterized protein (DUF1330 family)